MSINSSSFLSSLSPSDALRNCFNSTEANLIFIIFTSTNILLLLPLCACVLYVAHERWREQCPVSAGASDQISYHMVVMETISILASILYCTGVYLGLLTIAMVAAHLFLIAMCGQMLFYSIMCTECYLGVVHPLMYLQMKQGPGLRIRNSVIGLIWLTTCAMMTLVALNTLQFILLIFFVQQVFSLAVVSFCICPVLRVLKRPGPGEGGGSRERFDQSKLRAFHTIKAITAVLVLRFGGNLVCTVLYATPQLSKWDQCVLIYSGFWFCLPSSLMSPLLFLHRAGKLFCFRTRNRSEQTST